MQNLERFKFIGNALRGDGGFRPVVTTDSEGRASDVGESYLVRYPREADDKFARRNQVAYYASPLHAAASRFASHIASKPVSREIGSDFYATMADNIDGKSASIDVFMQSFMVQAKARGSMLLLVDMPSEAPETLAAQMSGGFLPKWRAIDPAQVVDFTVDDAGLFERIEFNGTFYENGEKPKPCVWVFDAEQWECRDKSDKTLAEGTHPLGKNPVIAFTEAGDFPHYGTFAPIADLSKRLFNLESELDEILRSQTFSVLTMQIPPETAAEMMGEAAKVAGETISTHNLLVHTGTTPAYIAPPDGPASMYMQRIEKVESRINEIALQVAQPNQRESGVAMQMRFQQINAELAKFAQSMEDFERSAWELSARWLGQSSYPQISWPRDFHIADITQELDVLREMQGAAMEPEVLREQRLKVTNTQFDSLDDDSLEALRSAIENGASAA